MSSGGVFPRGGPRATGSVAERRFFDALVNGLPKGWAAWHSLRLRTRENLEGEGDFVIALPDRGAIVVEVKGGAIEVRDGTWLQNGRPMDPLPRDAGHRFRKKLAARLAEQGCRTWIVVATAFPDTAFDREPSQGDVRGAVLGAHDLAYLAEALPALAERLFAGAPRPTQTRWMGALHSIWGETWRPRLSLGSRARRRADDLVALDREQIDLLDLVDHNPRLLVLGGPGTGKTLLAREMLARLRARGKRPVLLCWTSALARELRASGLAHAWTVRELAAELLERAQVPLQSGAPRAQWSPASWDLAPLQAAVDALPVQATFDAVVVDEAQDLTSNDWELVRALAGAGPMWAFADEGQGFWEDRAVPEGLFGASFALKRRYRCPEALARFADLYRRAGAPIEPPSELRVIRASGPGSLADRVALEIRKALADGAAPSDLAVLSLAGQTRTRLCAAGRIGGCEVVRADDDRAAEHVVADTFLRFKGLERPWIIVTELDLGTTRYDVRMHIALSRATVGCVVVATSEEIARDDRLAAVAGSTT
ncbi:MAG: AAA family ATPase [Deltaproteobacteria bacterium]|nr:AAA family ATPase [Deltaproteobacteria bacterium]